MSDGRISYDITAGAPGFAAAFAGVKSTVGQTVGQLRGLSGPLSQLGGSLGGLGPMGGVIGQVTGPLRGVGEAITGSVKSGGGIAGVGAGGAAAIVGLGTAAVAAGAAILGATIPIMHLGAELAHLSLRTGQSTADLLRMQRAFKAAGMSGDEVGPMVNRLQSALSGVNEMGERTEETFAALGLNIAKLRGMTTVQQFQAIAAALAKVQNQADKVRIMKNLFGREGASLLPVFAHAGNLAAPLSAGSQLLAKNAETFAHVTALLGQTGNVVRSFFIGVADRVAPVLIPLLEKFNRLDFSKWGQQLGNVFVVIAQAFQEGKLGALIGLSLKVGFMEAVDFLAGALAGVATMLGGMIGPVLAVSFEFLTDPNLWKGLADGLEAAVAKFGAAFLACFREPLSYISATFEKIAQKLAQALTWAWNKLAETSLGKKLGMKELEVKDNRSFEQMRQDYLKDSKATEGAFNGTAGKDWQAGKSELGAAVSARMPEIAAIIAKAMTDFKGGQKNLNFFGDSKKPLEDHLRKLFDSLLAHAAKGKATQDKSQPSSTSDFSKLGRMGEHADALQRVGLFLGGSNAAVGDYNKKTADNTAKLVTVSTQMLYAIQAGSHGGFENLGAA